MSSDVDELEANGNFKQSNTAFYVVLGVLVLGLLGVGLYFGLRQPPANPDRVVLLITGPPAVTTTVQESLSEQLGEQGFAAHPGKDKDGEAREYPLAEGATLEQALEAARDLGAAHVAHIDISIKHERPGLSKGGQFLAARAVLQLQSAHGAYPAPAPRKIDFAVEDKSREEAVAAMGRGFAEALFPPLADSLLESPPMVEMLGRKQGFDDLVNAQRFRGTQKARTNRKEKKQQYETSCKQAQAKLDALAQGKPAVMCATSACDEEYLSGVMPSGDQALVRVETGRAEYTFEFEPKLLRFETPDRLDLLPLGEGKRTTLAVAQNLYTYPDLAADGSKAALVEKAGRHYGVVVVDLKTQKRTIVTTVPWPARVQWAKLSADGSLVMFYLRESKFGDGVLEVTSSAGGAEAKTLVGLPNNARWVELVHDGKKRTLVALVTQQALLEQAQAASEPTPAAEKTPAPESQAEADEEEPPKPRYRIALIDPESGQPLAELGADAKDFTLVGGSHDGALIAGYRDQETRECGLARLRLGEEPELSKLDRCPSRLRLAPDGLVVAEQGITLVGLQLGSPAAKQLLPKLPGRARYPRFASQGKRMVFELLLAQKQRGFPRSAICYVDR